MEDFNRQHQDTLLPSLLPQTNTGDTRRDSSGPTQTGAIGASAPLNDDTITPSTDIQGLREQIFSNAAVLFPKVTFQYQGNYAPRDIFDVVTVRSPRSQTQPSEINKAVKGQTTYGWEACLVYGPVNRRSGLASGAFRNSIEAALQALLEFLAEKIMPRRHFLMPHMQRDHGSGGWCDSSMLGPHDMIHGRGEERKRPRTE